VRLHHAKVPNRPRNGKVAHVELLTIADIAKRLELPESTVRYYRDRFAPYVPSVGEGRGRRYRPEALAVLRFIADALRSIAEETTQHLLDELRKTAAELRSVADENAALRKEIENQQQQMAATLEREHEEGERRQE